MNDFSHKAIIVLMWVTFHKYNAITLCNLFCIQIVTQLKLWSVIHDTFTVLTNKSRDFDFLRLFLKNMKINHSMNTTTVHDTCQHIHFSKFNKITFEFFCKLSSVFDDISHEQTITCPLNLHNYQEFSFRMTLNYPWLLYSFMITQLTLLG